MTGERKPWQFDCECPQCHDIIHSRYAGEYRSCKCGAMAVDQTPHYWRAIGVKPIVKAHEPDRTD